ncbi:ABC transporter permease [Acidimicrobiia bacterium EGI L10123]|uniref:ABC transporter permease n=1 Tax=Salinilacustrithrix flava TaxID=2957203 RepID=UPI003D7C26E0|nr:ABC transporter permease [Acidimicrobiia bacterium EGI L10123]
MNNALRKLGQLALVLFLVTLFTALLVSLLPGDPAEVIIPFGDESDREALREELNLDDPLPVRYVAWLGDFVTGDMGNYYRQSITEPVADRVTQAAPVSLLLMLYAQVLALVIAIPLGVITAQRAGSFFDKFTNTTAFGILAIPNFVLALVLSYVVGVELGWLPPQGYVRFSNDIGEHFRSMILPSISLAAGQVAVYMRLLRTDMVATLQEDFILMAKAKGLSNKRVLWRHALRPSSLTLLTVAGLNVGTLVGGALIIEIIFTLPGMGVLIFQAISERQYVAIQSLVALIAVGYVLVNVFVDMLYAALDPRIRSARG